MTVESRCNMDWLDPCVLIHTTRGTGYCQLDCHCGDEEECHIILFRGTEAWQQEQEIMVCDMLPLNITTIF